jgi:hypothetical protein
VKKTGCEVHHAVSDTKTEVICCEQTKKIKMPHVLQGQDQAGKELAVSGQEQYVANLCRTKLLRKKRYLFEGKNSVS